MEWWGVRSGKWERCDGEQSDRYSPGNVWENTKQGGFWTGKTKVEGLIKRRCMDTEDSEQWRAN